MSDFFRPMTQQASRVLRQCECCAYAIEKGAVYCKQSGIFEGSHFTNHYHPECWDALSADGNFEFSPGDGDPPEGARTMAEARAAAATQQGQT